MKGRLKKENSHLASSTDPGALGRKEILGRDMGEQTGRLQQMLVEVKKATMTERILDFQTLP
eukprot:1168739-Prorocentrum_lima.AAC.1